MMQRYAKVDLATGMLIEVVGMMSGIQAASHNADSRLTGVLLVPKTTLTDGRYIPRLTVKQERQIHHMERLQSGEELHNLHTYNMSCEDCNEHRECHTAGTVIDFIRKRHMGHNTSYLILGVSNPLRAGR